jgi:hypothetical protein
MKQPKPFNFRDVTSGLRFEAPVSDDYGDVAEDVAQSINMPSSVGVAGLLALHGYDGGSYGTSRLGAVSINQRAEAYDRAYRPFDGDRLSNPGRTLQLRKRMAAGGVYAVREAGSFEPRDYTPAPIKNDLEGLFDDAIESFKTSPIIPLLLTAGVLWYFSRNSKWLKLTPRDRFRA